MADAIFDDLIDLKDFEFTVLYEKPLYFQTKYLKEEKGKHVIQLALASQILSPSDYFQTKVAEVFHEVREVTMVYNDGVRARDAHQLAIMETIALSRELGITSNLVIRYWRDNGLSRENTGHASSFANNEVLKAISLWESWQ